MKPMWNFVKRQSRGSLACKGAEPHLIKMGLEYFLVKFRNDLSENR